MRGPFDWLWKLIKRGRWPIVSRGPRVTGVVEQFFLPALVVAIIAAVVWQVVVWSAHTGDAVVIVTESVPRVSGVVEQ